jgi:hypothetical protein
MTSKNVKLEMLIFMQWTLETSYEFLKDRRPGIRFLVIQVLRS